MKFFKYAIAVPAVLVLLFSCKKENSEDSKLYFSVYPKLDHTLPPFVQAGESFSFSISGAARSRDDKSTATIGYAMYSTGRKTDTLRFEGGSATLPYSVTIPDTLKAFNVTGYAFAEGYYSASTSTSATVVKPGLDGNGSITGFDSDGESFTDTRDGSIYYTTGIEGVLWTRNNLEWKGKGKPFSLCGCMDGVIGRFYNWTEAQTACPDGWQLPGSADFDAVVGKYGNVGALLAPASFNGMQMWEYRPEIQLSNESRLSFLPSGYGVYGTSGTTFTDMFERAVFWTSDSSGELGIARYVYKDRNILYNGEMSKEDFYASVRCIKKQTN